MGDHKKRAQQMEHTITLIQSRWGLQAIRKANDAAVPAPVLSSGFRNVDSALGIGGFPRGKITELVASGTAGQGALIAKTLCCAQQGGQQVVYVDIDYTLDIDFLARCGVDIGPLVVLRPFGFRHALEMLTDLVRSGGADVIVLDRLHPTLSSDDILRLNGSLREWPPLLARSLCTLFVLTETVQNDWYPPELALPSFASVRLALQQKGWLRDRRRISGFTSQVTILKNRLGPAGQVVQIRINLNNHIHGEGDD